MVLDDDEDSAALLGYALESRGFDVAVARSCEEARALLDVASVDALVTDLSLGDGDAFELMAALGARRPRVTVLVTGYGSREDRARSRAAGFDAHLVKPIAVDEVEQALRLALDREEPHLAAGGPHAGVP